jgi:hypothetical protein
MAIMIREYGGYSKFDVEYNVPLDASHVKEAMESLLSEPVSPSSLMVDIEGIHAYPHATRNFTRYMPECLKKSVPTWTKPYRRPLIKHHNEKDGEIIGRICAIEYVTNKTLSGTPALLFTANIPGEQAKADVQDGLLETVSIGIIAHDVRCSICGHQIAEEGPCQEHDRGQVYRGEVCYWDIYSMEAKELSYVIVPSDVFAKNVRSYPAISKKPTNSINESAQKGGKTSMTPEEIAALKEELDTANTANQTLIEAKATLEGQVTTLTEEKAVLETKVTELTAANITLTEANTTLVTSNTELTEGKTALEIEVAQEKQLRESLENEMVAVKTEVKTNLVETVQAMRKATGKTELTEDIIKSRTEDSLRDAIKDLKEELKPVMPVPGSVKSPALAEKDENIDGLDVKEKNSARNIDLQEGLENLFNLVANAHK